MLAASFSDHEQVHDYTWSKDSELDAAQILAGTKQIDQSQRSDVRYCFQTTYLNERYVEYEQHVGQFYLIWLIRNPHSVVYSMLYNWKRFALNEVFLSCGKGFLNEKQKSRIERFGMLGLAPIYRACYAYLGKLQQCEELLTLLPADRFRTVEYEVLVAQKTQVMNELFDFAQLSRQPETAGTIHTNSLRKADKFSAKEKQIVAELCEPAYERLRANRSKSTNT